MTRLRDCGPATDVPVAAAGRRGARAWPRWTSARLPARQSRSVVTGPDLAPADAAAARYAAAAARNTAAAAARNAAAAARNAARRRRRLCAAVRSA